MKKNKKEEDEFVLKTMTNIFNDIVKANEFEDDIGAKLLYITGAFDVANMVSSMIDIGYTKDQIKMVCNRIKEEMAIVEKEYILVNP
jgi:hypothetical protein